MSYTRLVKHELSGSVRHNPCCGSQVLAAMICLQGYLSILNCRHLLSVQVEYNAIARYLFRLFKEHLSGCDPVVIKQHEKRLHKTRYIVQVEGPERIEELLTRLELQKTGQVPYVSRSLYRPPEKWCCRRAFLKGAFLAGGSLSLSRRSRYHLEICCNYLEDAQLLRELMVYFEVKASLRHRKGFFYLYLKSAEAIADFLRIVGANNCLLELENIRVIKNMRGNINRLVNCETANLEKIVASAQQQLAAIKVVDKLIGINNLPHALQDAARVRLRYPESSLKELGEKLSPPVSKSSMSYRFRQLERLSRKVNQQEIIEQ